MRADVSIIIPVAPSDTSWKSLVRNLPPGVPVFLVGTEIPKDIPLVFNRIGSPLGRAIQMNTAARWVTTRYVWFLHADSLLNVRGVERLDAALLESPEALHYFDLHFHDGPWLMKLTQWGVWFRSHLGSLPFGDQGFVLPKVLFDRLGGYDETAAYGEDALFVMRARREGIYPRCVGASLSTSARKYRVRGWLRTTVSHWVLTLRLLMFESARASRR